jgi:hypothetical protein
MDRTPDNGSIEAISRVRTVVDTSEQGDTAREGHLENYIVGDSGLNILLQNPSLMVESGVKSKLEGWLSRESNPQVLWISGPYEPRHLSSARSASLAIVATANSIGAPVISHFCEKPMSSDKLETQDLENIGLIGLLYSLIHQLMKFGTGKLNVTDNNERLIALNGALESWPQGISLLDDLLQAGSCVQYCIIHGLNDLESGIGSERCSQLVDLLIKRQNARNTAFNLLFTTTGQSRVLSKAILFKNRYSFTKKIGEVEKRGKKLTYPTRTVQ